MQVMVSHMHVKVVDFVVVVVVVVYFNRFTNGQNHMGQKPMGQTHKRETELRQCTLHNE